MEPDNTDMQMQLALVHEMIEEDDMALMIYQKIIETNPNYIRAYIQKATLYMHLEDYLNSAKFFKKVLKWTKHKRMAVRSLFQKVCYLLFVLILLLIFFLLLLVYQSFLLKD